MMHPGGLMLSSFGACKITYNSTWPTNLKFMIYYLSHYSTLLTIVVLVFLFYGIQRMQALIFFFTVKMLIE